MVPRTCQSGVRYCSVSARATPLRCSTGLAISPDTSNRYRENRDDLSAARHCPQLGRLLRPRPRGLPAGSAWPPKNDSLWAAPLHLTPGIQPAGELSIHELLAECCPGDILHHQIVHSLLSVKVVDDGNVRMVQPGEDSRFFVELLACGFVSHRALWENFECDIAVEVLIVGAVNVPHAALANLLENAVVPQSLPQ